MRNRLIGGMLAMLLLATLPAAAFAQVSIGVSVNLAPPALPVYTQPPAPAVGYMWAPGYWAWDPNYGDYYWVPGTWVEAPQPGLLWTPGWWGWSAGAYLWHQGYWGPQVGFYGGVDYGFGYNGGGYYGGRWQGNQFYYNRTVNNISSTTNITNVYNEAAPAPRGGESHVSYNGGQGGIQAQPTAEQRTAMNAHHIGPTAAQTQQEHAASTNREMRASVNQGKPAVAATTRPGEFSGKGVVAAVAAGGAMHAAAGRREPQRNAKAEERQRAGQQRSTKAEERAHAEQQRSAQAEARQRAEQQRNAQAEERQRAEQQRSAQAAARTRAEPPARIREAQAPPRSREQPQAPHGNEHADARRPPPKKEESPRGPGG
jgi:hypothetical protein